MQAAKYRTEIPSIPAQPALALSQMWQSKCRTARRQWSKGGTLLCSSYKQDNIRRQEITQAGMEVLGSWAGEVEVGVSMTEAPHRFLTQSLNVSQLISS
jgi:hypothetical protein